jgi:hypothetical protein
MRLIQAFAFVWLLSALPVVAFAQGEPSAAEIAVARKLFGEASELEGKKEWAEAEGKLREALTIKETPGLRYHLGYCLEQQSKLVAALVEYDRAAEMLERGTKAPDVAELVGPARDGVKKRVSSVTLKMPKDLESAEVRIDGVVIKAALIDKAIPIDPGQRVVTVSSPGRQAFRRELDLGEAEAREIEVDLPRLGNTKGGYTPAGDASAEPSDAGGSVSSSGIPARTWVLIGEGALTAFAIGSGIFFTIDKGKAQDEIDEAQAFIDEQSGGSPSACTTSTADGVPEACEDLATITDQRDRSKTLAVVSFVGAGVGAAAIVTTLLVWKPKPSAAESGKLIRPRIQPRVVVGPRAAFVGVGGSF